jgi:hypothetical protein
MRKLAIIAWLIPLMGFVAFAASTSTQSQTNNSLIDSGKSIGLLSLGMSRAEVESVFPLKKDSGEGNTYDENTYSECGTFTEINWVNFSGDRAEWGNVFIYLRGGKVFQIESALPRYRTIEGIGSGSLPDLVRKHYNNLEAHALHASGGQMFDFHDFIYWVSRDKGIAFELAYNRKERRRFVYKVIVFEPNTGFVPEGCIFPPQEWIKIPPYSLSYP